jgi:hypothetical protein
MEISDALRKDKPPWASTRDPFPHLHLGITREPADSPCVEAAKKKKNSGVRRPGKAETWKLFLLETCVMVLRPSAEP